MALEALGVSRNPCRPLHLAIRKSGTSLLVMNKTGTSKGVSKEAVSSTSFYMRRRLAALVGDEGTQVVFDVDVYPAVGAVVDA